MITIFKTTVKTKKAIKILQPELDRIIANSKWNFDIDDCDKILRIESVEDITLSVIGILNKYDFFCEELK